MLLGFIILTPDMDMTRFLGPMVSSSPCSVSTHRMHRHFVRKLIRAVGFCCPTFALRCYQTFLECRRYRCAIALSSVARLTADNVNLTNVGEWYTVALHCVTWRSVRFVEVEEVIIDAHVKPFVTLQESQASRRLRDYALPVVVFSCFRRS